MTARIIGRRFTNLSFTDGRIERLTFFFLLCFCARRDASAITCSRDAAVRRSSAVCRLLPAARRLSADELALSAADALRRGLAASLEAVILARFLWSLIPINLLYCLSVFNAFKRTYSYSYFTLSNEEIQSYLTITLILVRMNHVQAGALAVPCTCNPLQQG